MPQKLARISRWGNSAALRLPASVLERSDLCPDDAVEITTEPGRITITRKSHRPTLDDLLSRFDPEKHRHALILD